VAARKNNKQRCIDIMRQRKKHKVTFEHTTQRLDYDFVKLTEYLNDKEFECLKQCIRNNKDSGTMALYEFTHSEICSKRHKYQIWNTFDEGEISIIIE
jgi:hypothetical protein